MTTERPVRVMIADDDERLCAALCDMVSAEPGLELVGFARDGAEAVRLAVDAHPDVALVDVRMPRGGGVAATESIVALSNPPRVVAHSASGAQAQVLEMLTAGAVGYLLKGCSRAELVSTLQRAADGGSTLSPEVTGTVVGRLATQLKQDRDAEQARESQRRRIRALLAGGGPRAVFQPIVALGDGSVQGYEALARFDPPPSQEPPEWFEQAACVGLGPELELAAARSAFERYSQAWRPAAPWLSVNASPTTASDPRFASLVEAADGRGIVVEVTEHDAVDDYPALSRALARLRPAGVRVAVDDVGAGYASLHHLLRLEPDLIKLDLSLTRGIDEEPAQRALAAALVAFAAEIGAELVAEGIETEGELGALRDLGVGHGQGFRLGRPGPLPSIEKRTP